MKNNDNLYLPNLLIRVLSDRIDVSSNRPLKEDGLLRYNAKARPEIMKAYCANVYSVDNDLASARLY